jgi:hypothetical protein
MNKVPAVGLLFCFGAGRDAENIFSLFITWKMFREAKKPTSRTTSRSLENKRRERSFPEFILFI